MQTAIQIEDEHLEALKRLATRLGLFQTRGAGAGTLPSVSAAVRLLADLSNNEKFVEFVEMLMEEKK